MVGIKREVPFNLKEFLLGDEPKTFLVGAGCSIEPPSCLPGGRTIMETIINSICPISELESLYEILPQFRLETLIETVISFQIDAELKLIDYFSQCDKPNRQHFFLAEMLKKGHFLVTTNFDFLLEHALMLSGIPREKIIPVITRADFEQFSNPDELLKNGKMPIYKIHGSTKNIIKELNEEHDYETRDSLITTLRALGSNKEGKNIFQLEDFKQELFENISRDRSLTVMGYSGFDDFDIVPTLKVLKNLRKVVWIKHLEESQGQIRVYEISGENNEIKSESKRIDQILNEIKAFNRGLRVYRVDTNISWLIKDITGKFPLNDTPPFKESLLDWIETQFRTPNEIEKYLIAKNIYDLTTHYERELFCVEKAHQLALDLGNSYWITETLHNLGAVHGSLGNIDKALEIFKVLLPIAVEENDYERLASLHLNIGSIYAPQGKPYKGLEHLKKAWSIARRHNIDKEKANILSTLGNVYTSLKNYPMAFKYLNIALKSAEQRGNMEYKSSILNNIVHAINQKIDISPPSKKDFKDLLNAEAKIQEAIQICSRLGNLQGLAICHFNYGFIYFLRKQYSEALSNVDTGIEILSSFGERFLDLIVEFEKLRSRIIQKMKLRRKKSKSK